MLHSGPHGGRGLGSGGSSSASRLCHGQWRQNPEDLGIIGQSQDGRRAETQERFVWTRNTWTLLKSHPKITNTVQVCRVHKNSPTGQLKGLGFWDPYGVPYGRCTLWIVLVRERVFMMMLCLFYLLPINNIFFLQTEHLKGCVFNLFPFGLNTLNLCKSSLKPVKIQVKLVWIHNMLYIFYIYIYHTIWSYFQFKLTARSLTLLSGYQGRAAVRSLPTERAWPWVWMTAVFWWWTQTLWKTWSASITGGSSSPTSASLLVRVNDICLFGCGTMLSFLGLVLV